MKLGYDYNDEEENEFNPEDVLRQMTNLQKRIDDLFEV